MVNTDSLLELLKDNTYWVGEGASRTVYSLSPQVVGKVSHCSNCVQSPQEILFHATHYEEWSHFMCDIYGWTRNADNKYVIFMESVEPLGDLVQDYIQDNYHEDEARELMKMIIEFEEITGLRDSSDNGDNWGVDDYGNLKVMDYGLNETNICEWRYHCHDDCECDECQNYRYGYENYSYG